MTPDEIFSFATRTKGAKFDFFRKVEVNGAAAHPLEVADRDAARHAGPLAEEEPLVGVEPPQHVEERLAARALLGEAIRHFSRATPRPAAVPRVLIAPPVACHMLAVRPRWPPPALLVLLPASRFGGAPYADVVLNAGEVLYIPPHWWHFVEARETSFSVSFWWR